MQRLLIVGCGDVARRALPWLVRHYRVYAVIRNEADGKDLRQLGVTPIRADLDRKGTLARLAGIGNLVLHFAPPSERGTRDVRTRRLVAALARASILPRRLIYISTSGVYGDCRGEHVAETRRLNPQTPRGQRRADAESVLRRFGRECRVSVGVLRVPGIYASDRLPLDRLRRGDPVLRQEDDVYTNHIHAEDLARIAGLALTRARSGRTYNASDDSGLRMGEYFDLVADCFDLPRPRRLARSEAQAHLSPVTMSFMSESRRLENLRLKQELGVRLRYPDVFAGIDAALTEGKH